MMSGMTPLTEFEPRRTGLPAHGTLLVRSVVGEAIKPFASDIARLRATVFRAWPYLYDADVADEATYLQAWRDSWRSVAVLAFDGSQLVGASLGLPLEDAQASWRRAFTAAGREVGRVFHFGGSVLLPPYRGRGLGHRFFDERESQARALGGFGLTAFHTVERAVDDPRRPPFGHGHEPFWRKRGYRPDDGINATAEWNEPGIGLVTHRMTTWLRPLERG